MIESLHLAPVKDEEPTFGEVAEDSAETAAESQTAPVESTEEKQPSKRSQKVKRLAGKLTQAEQENQELRQRIERLEQAGRVVQPEKATQSAPDPNAYPVPRPKGEDFPDPQDAIEAISDWKADEREWKAEQKAKIEAQREVITAHFERVEEIRDKHEDFDDAIGEAKDVRFRDDDSRDAFYAAIYENEDGPEILYYIAKHPDIAESFVDLKPLQVAT